jgi:hypothetical protein
MTELAQLPRDSGRNPSTPSVAEALPPRIQALARIEERFSTIEFFALILSVLFAVTAGSYIAVNGVKPYLDGSGDLVSQAILFLWSSITIWALLWNGVVRIPEWCLRVIKDWPGDAAILAYRLHGVATKLSLPIPEGLVSSEPKVVEAVTWSRQKLAEQVEVLAGRIEALDIITNRRTRREWAKSLTRDMSPLCADAAKFARSIEACRRLEAMTSASGRDIARNVLLDHLPLVATRPRLETAPGEIGRCQCREDS